jgi:hypothetical protein
MQRAKDSRVFQIIVTTVPCKMSALLSGVASLGFLAVQNRNSDNSMVFKREAEAGTRRLPKSSRLRNRPGRSSPSSGTTTTFDSLQRKAVFWQSLRRRSHFDRSCAASRRSIGRRDCHARWRRSRQPPRFSRRVSRRSPRRFHQRPALVRTAGSIRTCAIPGGAKVCASHLAHRQAMAHWLGRNLLRFPV